MNEEYRRGYRDGWRDAMEEVGDKTKFKNPTLPNTKPNWPIDMMPAYYRCATCGLLKTNMTMDCPRQDCSHNKITITYTTDSTSGK